MGISSESRGKVVAADPQQQVCVPGSSLQPLHAPVLGMPFSLESNASVSPWQDIFTVPFVLARVLHSPPVQTAGSVVAPPAMVGVDPSASPCHTS